MDRVRIDLSDEQASISTNRLRKTTTDLGLPNDIGSG
jgi:hypothetical protein